MRFLIIFAIGIMSLAASANPVSDPYSKLSIVDAFLGPQTFESTFVCGDVARYKEITTSLELSCENGFCFTLSMSPDVIPIVNYGIANCASDGVDIFTESGALIHVDKNEFEITGSNIARYVLAHIDSFVSINDKSGQIVVTDVKNSKFKIKLKGVETEIPTLNIFADFKLNSSSVPVVVSVTQMKSPSIASLLRFRMDNKTLFLLDEIN